jgi:hypothetical protein
MTIRQQLAQRPPVRTNIESTSFPWTDSFLEPATQTSLEITSNPQIRAVLDAFAQWFELTQASPVMKLTYCSLADEISDTVSTRRVWRTWIEDFSSFKSLTTSESEARNDTASLLAQLIAWLGITYEELARITGVGRSTLFYWRGEGVLPRGRNARQLLRVHSLASLLVKRFGVDGARKWLHSGTPTPWDLLLVGQVEEAERLAKERLFGQPGPRPGASNSITDEIDVPVRSANERPLQRASRRPTRGRLTSRDQ